MKGNKTMKAKQMTVVAAAVAAFAHITCATADVEPKYVSTVAELTAAVTSAAAGDTIVIKAGTYAPSADDFMDEDSTNAKSFLKVSVANLTIIGEDSSSRKTWTSGSEPVVIDMGENGRFVRNSGGRLTVGNIAITGCKLSSNQDGTIAYGGADQNESSTFTNCVFRQNKGAQSSFWVHSMHLVDCAYVSNSCMLNGYLSDCDISGNTSRVQYARQMRGCTFSGHSLNSSLILFANGHGVVSNCTFSANKSNGGIIDCTSRYFARSAQIVDCRFNDNTNRLIVANTKYNESDTDSIVVSNCTFTSNVVAENPYTWSPSALAYGLLIDNITNNFTSAGAAQARFLVVDSTFVNSKSTASAGRGMTEVMGVTARGCKFDRQFFAYSDDGNIINNYNCINMSALNSRLEACDVSGGAVADCIVDRCAFHDIPMGAYACFRDYCRVTNSLVMNASAPVYAPMLRQDAEFVSCTFVTNSGVTCCATKIMDYATRNPVKFKNCLFNSNVSNGNASDITLDSNSAKNLDCWTNYVSFANSYYGKFRPGTGLEGYVLTAAVFATTTNAPNSLALCEDPKFIGKVAAESERYPDEPYWALSTRSPLLGAGNTLGYTALDLDLAGRPRIRDGKIDVGCYQCWLNPLGLIIIFR